MNEASLIDFYRGWFIEVEPGSAGFKSTCYSPCRKTMTLPTFASEFEALQAAKQQIDYHIACAMVAGVMRELYEAGSLEFEDWMALQHSLL